MDPQHAHTRLATTLLLLIGAMLASLLPGAFTAVAQSTTTTASLVQTIDTSLWNPPSPDPSGITYWPARDTLMIVDGEVDEMANLYQGFNIFEATRTGNLVRPHTTKNFSREPVGIEITLNPTNGHFFISDDVKKTVFEIDPGPDLRIGTGDDTMTSFKTDAFGNNDPEGIAFGQGKLYITDGAGSEVYTVNPGANGKFDGVPPAGDDTVTHFDTAVLGQPDPEGIDFNHDTGTLFLISNKRKSPITETTVSGGFIRSIDLAFLNALASSDLTFAPGSTDSSVQTLYITDRGVDNNDDPTENDGKIYEVKLAGSTSTSNLLRNGSFEDDCCPADGKPDQWSTNAKFTRNSGEAIAQHGTYVGKFLATDNTGVTIKQTVNASAGLIRASCWVNIPDTNDSFSFSLQVKWRDANNNALGTATISTYTVDTDGQWTQAAKDLQAPAGTAKAIVLLKAGSLNGTIYIDHCVLRP